MQKILFQNHLVICVIACTALVINLSECFSKRKYNKYLKDSDSLNESLSNRNSRNFFPFVWVTFPPGPCENDQSATCVPRGRCLKYRGTTGGQCQYGIGECCTFSHECNSTQDVIEVNQPVTILKSAPEDNQCSFRFKRETNICQIKLDFIRFQSEKANLTGDCDVDQLKILNSATVDNFITCGKLTGQHMYLTFGSTDIDVIPRLQQRGSSFEIRATRIACDSNARAPDHCLQYFTTQAGRVKSFDFGGQQQNNQQYVACVKKKASMTKIKWSLCANETDSFSIRSIYTGEERCDDFIEIRGEERQCSNNTFMGATSSWKPFELLVNFDRTEIPDPPANFPPLGPITDAESCNRECGKIVLPDLECGCNTADNLTCICTGLVTARSIRQSRQGPFAAPDIENKGFCLDFDQTI